MDTLVAEPIVTPSVNPEPVSTPAAETTPVTTPAVTPEAPAAAVVPTGEGDAKPEYKAGTDFPEHLKKVLKWQEAHPEGTPAKPVTEEVKTEPVVEKTQEEKDADAKAAEEAAEKAKTEQKVETSPFDKSGPLPAEKLAAALLEDKALNDALAGKTIKLDDGREINLKDAVFEASRVAAQAAPILEIAPTLEAAQEMQQGAQVFYDLDTKFPAIKDTQSLDQFMVDTLIPLSFVRDAEGKPIPDPENPGMYKNDGSVQRFAGLMEDVSFNILGKIAENIAGSGNEAQKEYAADLSAAIKFVNDFRSNGYRMPGTPSGEKPVIPAETQAELDRLRARDREVSDREVAQQKQQHETFEEKITDSTFEQVTPLIEKVIGASSLSDYEKKTVAEKVWQDMTEKLDANPAFKRGIEQMMSRRELNDAVQQRRVAHNVSYMKSVIAGILDKRMAEAGAKRMEAKAALDSKRDSQIAQSKMEPRSGATVAASETKALDGDAMHAKAIELARAENGGREPNPADIYRQVLKLKGLIVKSA